MSNFYRHFKRNIAANSMVRIDAYANFLTIMENSSATNAKLSFDGGSAEEIPKGFSVELPQDEKLNFIILHNPTAAVMTIEVVLSVGRVFDNRVNLSGTLAVTDVSDEIAAPAKLEMNVGNNYVRSLAANASRRELLIQNNGTVDVWVGDSNVDPANSRGIKLEPADTLSLDSSATVYFKTNAVDGEVSIIYLSKS